MIVPLVAVFSFIAKDLHFAKQSGLLGEKTQVIGDITAISYIDTYGQMIYEMARSEEHTSELQSRGHLVCRLLLEKKKKKKECIEIRMNTTIMRINMSDI